MNLSVRRAQVVADFLTSHGVEPEILRVQGCSTFAPIIQRVYTPDARLVNRRVEVESTDTLVSERQGVHPPDAKSGSSCQPSHRITTVIRPHIPPTPSNSPKATTCHFPDRLSAKGNPSCQEGYGILLDSHLFTLWILFLKRPAFCLLCEWYLLCDPFEIMELGHNLCSRAAWKSMTAGFR